MLDVLSFCHIQQRLFIIGLMQQYCLVTYENLFCVCMVTKETAAKWRE